MSRINRHPVCLTEYIEVFGAFSRYLLHTIRNVFKEFCAVKYRKTSPTTRTSSNPRTRQQRAGQTVFFIEERAPVKSAHPLSPRTTKPSKTRNLCELQ